MLENLQEWSILATLLPLDLNKQGREGTLVNVKSGHS